MARIITIFIITLILSCSPAHALRVVSLYPGHSDNIYALDSGDSLVALSQHDNPQLLPHLPRLSLKAGAESLLALHPDIVITRSVTRSLNPEMYRVLEQAGVRVLTLDPPDWSTFPQYLAALAQAIGVDPAHALRKLDELTHAIADRVPHDRPRPRVFLEATSRELRTCAPDSWAANVIALAGGENIAHNAQPLRTGSALASWGVERVLQAADSIDVYIIQTGVMNTATVSDFHARTWSRALTRAKVCEVPEMFISRPSLLGLERGANMLMNIFWGE